MASLIFFESEIGGPSLSDIENYAYVHNYLDIKPPKDLCCFFS